MQIKFTEAEQEHFNRVRTLHAEAQRQFLQLDSVLRGFLNCVAGNWGVKERPVAVLPDGSGLHVVEPMNVNLKRHT
jgi:hypothetical protein